MAISLGSRAAHKYRLTVLEATDSTNEEVLRYGRRGDTGHLWLVAMRQTAGRGRHGNVWEHQNDGLAASLLLVMKREINKLGGSLGFVAGLSLLDALVATCGSDVACQERSTRGGIQCGKHSRLALKWPNDLLMDGKKIAGVLVETERLPNGSTAVVVGIGVNVRPSPVMASLADVFLDITAQDLFARLTDSWDRFFSHWEQGMLGSLILLWLDRAVGVGNRVSVLRGSDCISGIFETIDSDGSLVILTDEGRHRISSGEVYFGALRTC